MDFLSTPFDRTAVEFLEGIGCEAYKIASFELVDIPLIEYTAAKRKPMIISCGMGSIDEIEEAVDACKRVGNSQIVLLKCCSEYPANWAGMHLSNIPDMQKRFGINIGLSDHSMGAVVGVAIGACVVKNIFAYPVKLKIRIARLVWKSTNLPKWYKMCEMRSRCVIVKYGPSEREMPNLKFLRSLFAVCSAYFSLHLHLL